jgi:HSP20 family molecular chaperone IbpA
MDFHRAHLAKDCIAPRARMGATPPILRKCRSDAHNLPRWDERKRFYASFSMRAGNEDLICGESAEEKRMTEKRPEKAQAVKVVEADIFDTMTETTGMVAQRAYEIFETRGGRHGSDGDDVFKTEGEVLPELAVHYDVTENAVRLTAQVPGFDAKDLEVEVGHRRAVLFGLHAVSKQGADEGRKEKRLMGIAELPFDVDPASARATLEGGTLQVVLTRA